MVRGMCGGNLEEGCGTAVKGLRWNWRALDGLLMMRFGCGFLDLLLTTAWDYVAKDIFVHLVINTLLSSIFLVFFVFFIRNSMHPTSPHFTMTQLLGLATNQIASEKPLALFYTSNKRIDPFPFRAEVPCYLDSTHVLGLWSSLFLKTSELITLDWSESIVWLSL